MKTKEKKTSIFTIVDKGKRMKERRKRKEEGRQRKVGKRIKHKASL
jgi:hypothetical protein